MREKKGGNWILKNSNLVFDPLLLPPFLFQFFPFISSCSLSLSLLNFFARFSPCFRPVFPLFCMSEVTVLNPSDLLGKGKTCFSQKRYVRVIDWFREIRHAHQWELEELSWRWNNIACVYGLMPCSWNLCCRNRKPPIKKCGPRTNLRLTLGWILFIGRIFLIKKLQQWIVRDRNRGNAP
jgi:hypothetical protein